MSWSVPRPALIRNTGLGALLALSLTIAAGAAHAQDLVETVANEDETFSILVTTFSAESIGDYTLHLAVVEGA
jgi:hypothetical protein